MVNNSVMNTPRNLLGGGWGRPLPSQGLLWLVVQRMRTLAEPTRMRILLLLTEHEATVQELADELGLVHQNVSQHLNVLHRAGVLSRTREGSRVRYAIADFTVPALIQQAGASVLGQIEELAALADPSE
jgi:DNA-binding transcriptional ArsR family regulator